MKNSDTKQTDNLHLETTRPFCEGMRVQRISSHRIKGEVDYVRADGKVLVTWDVCGRWPIDAKDLRIIQPNDSSSATASQ